MTVYRFINSANDSKYFNTKHKKLTRLQKFGKLLKNICDFFIDVVQIIRWHWILNRQKKSSHSGQQMSGKVFSIGSHLIEYNSFNLHLISSSTMNELIVQSNALSPNEVIKIAKENSFLFKEFCVRLEL